MKFYYHPRGSAGRDFHPEAPDGGANNAGAYGPYHCAKWELTVLVSTGQTAGQCGFFAAQDAAFAQWAGIAPALQATAVAISGLRDSQEA